MKCQRGYEDSRGKFWYCVHCDEPVYMDEDRIDMGGLEILHVDCVMDYIKERFLVLGESRW